MKTKIILLLFLLNSAVNFGQQVTVYFDFDQFTLSPNSQRQLDSMVANKQISVSKIYGFCDWKGTNLYNDTLSLKRVRTVLEFFRNNNISIEKGYEIRGFGEDFKQSKIQSENRKVVIAYEIKKSVPQQTEVTKNASENWQDKIKNGKTGDHIKLENINFFNMSARIVQRSKTILQDLLCLLQENPNLKIEIQGHICCQLDGDLNGISVSRAKAIYNFLIANKINRDRLSFRGFGVTKPIYPIPEQNEYERDENRRVEIMILAK